MTRKYKLSARIDIQIGTISLVDEKITHELSISDVVDLVKQVCTGEDEPDRVDLIDCLEIYNIVDKEEYDNENPAIALKNRNHAATDWKMECVINNFDKFTQDEFEKWIESK